MAQHEYKNDIRILGIPPKELHRECGYDAQAIEEAARGMMKDAIKVNSSLLG